MKSNISKLDFVSDEADLYELAKQVNIVNEEEVIDKETIERIISLGLTNKVLNVIPYRIACYNMFRPKTIYPILIGRSYLSYNEKVIGLSGHCLNFYVRLCKQSADPFHCSVRFTQVESSKNFFRTFV